MKNLKLFRLLHTFSLQEFHEFGKFVNSPFFNESPKLIALYSAIKKFHPWFEDSKLEKEYLFKKLYGDESYDDKKMRDRLSDMQKLAEDFLAFNFFKKRPFDQKINTLREFSSRKLDIHFQKKYKEMRSLLDNYEIKNEEYYLKEYQLSYESLGFYEFKQLLGRRKPFFEAITGNIGDFQKYFSVQMLKYYSIMNNIRGTINFDFESNFYDTVLRFIRVNKLDDNPLIKGQLLMSVLINDPYNTEAFYELKKLYLRHHDELFVGDKVMFITELYNQANVKYLNEVPGFDKEVFDIIKLQLKHNMYPMQDGWMQREQFFVMLLAGQRFGTREWAEKFYNDMIDKVVPEQRENTRQWAKGYLDYINGDYTSSREELSKVKTTDFYYYLNTKSVLLKVYYEMSDFESALNLVDSYRHYLAANNFIPDRIKTGNLNFINSFGKLINLAVSSDDFKLDKFIKLLESYKLSEITIGKYWLLEKAFELKQTSKTPLHTA